MICLVLLLSERVLDDSCSVPQNTKEKVKNVPRSFASLEDDNGTFLFIINGGRRNASPTMEERYKL